MDFRTPGAGMMDLTSLPPAWTMTACSCPEWRSESQSHDSLTEMHRNLVGICYSRVTVPNLPPFYRNFVSAKA